MYAILYSLWYSQHRTVTKFNSKKGNAGKKKSFWETLLYYLPILFTDRLRFPGENNYFIIIDNIFFIYFDWLSFLITEFLCQNLNQFDLYVFLIILYSPVKINNIPPNVEKKFKKKDFSPEKYKKSRGKINCTTYYINHEQLTHLFFSNLKIGSNNNLILLDLDLVGIGSNQNWYRCPVSKFANVDILSEFRSITRCTNVLLNK